MFKLRDCVEMLHREEQPGKCLGEVFRHAISNKGSGELEREIFRQYEVILLFRD